MHRAPKSFSVVLRLCAFPNFYILKHNPPRNNIKTKIHGRLLGDRIDHVTETETREAVPTSLPSKDIVLMYFTKEITEPHWTLKVTL